MTTLTAHHEGFDLAYQRMDETGDPLLLVAGAGADMLYWHDDFCKALSQKGFQVTRFDNRDSGESSHVDVSRAASWRRVRRRPEAAPYRLEDMADDAVAVLDALSWPSAHVVGHSLGGMIAQVMAIRHPERVRSLTSISSTPNAVLSMPTLATKLRLMRAVVVPSVFGRGDAATRLIHGHRLIGSPAYPLDEEWLAQIAKMRQDRGEDPTAARRQQAAAFASGDLRDALRTVNIPTFVLHGDADPLVRPSGGKATASAIPGATLTMLPGMGHDLPRALWPHIVAGVVEVAGG